MNQDLLFSPVELGRIGLKNRVVMAPMTRSRALGNVPNELMARYYAQRAEAGLIVTEGTSPSSDGLGYARIPGLFDDAQVRGWKLVTDAVHTAGSRIFVQLMHTGRVTHPGNLPKGARHLAPSAIAPEGQMWVDGEGQLPIPAPQEMNEEDIQRAIDEFARSAGLAIAAGFDGVELHGANGYLIEQFLNPGSNLRKDRWGASGKVEDRIRFALEVARAAARRIGADRLGIRLSPFGTFNTMSVDPLVEPVYEALAKELSGEGLAYLHLVTGPHVPDSVRQKLRGAFKGKLILAAGYDRARAEADLRDKKGDLIAFARHFIGNPRLVTRLRKNAPLVPPDPSTFYTPGEKGYTDYPAEG